MSLTAQDLTRREGGSPMRDRRNRSIRWPLIATAFSFAGLLLYLGEYWESGQAPSLLPDRETARQVDFYLVEPRGLSYDEQGQVSHRFRAEYLQQLQGIDLTLATRPVFTGYSTQGEGWTARSQRGEIREAGREVTLIEGVVIDNAAGDSSLRTSRLVLFPKREFATTNAEVHLTGPGAVTDGIGLRADLALDRIELLNKVRGQHEAL